MYEEESSHIIKTSLHFGEAGGIILIAVEVTVNSHRYLNCSYHLTFLFIIPTDTFDNALGFGKFLDKSLDCGLKLFIFRVKCVMSFLLTQILPEPFNGI